MFVHVRRVYVTNGNNHHRQTLSSKSIVDVVESNFENRILEMFFFLLKLDIRGIVIREYLKYRKMEARNCIWILSGFRNIVLSVRWSVELRYESSSSSLLLFFIDIDIEIRISKNFLVRHWNWSRVNKNCIEFRKYRDRIF